MPAPLELLYQLRPFDTVTDLWGQRFFSTNQLTNQAAPTHLHASFTPPDDKVVFITKLWAWGAPVDPAGGFVISFRPIMLNAPRSGGGAPLSGVEIIDLGRIYMNDDRTAGRHKGTQRTVDIAIAGGQQFISFDVQFSQGDVGHVSRWGLHGYEVARGNVVLR